MGYRPYNPNNTGYWFIQYGTGNGSVSAQTAWPWGPHGYGAPFSGDFDGGGKGDIGFYNPNNQYNWFILYGFGNGIFGDQTVWYVGDASNW
ncbi:hypothetical protein [uncultured Shewanella sp.]|uniref:hypothetical protein n=1 Tax=uncultured Shewanella sp. TaxID=173975 RepID=UPI0026200DF7|nr:hypothetical protein [uncultured Shewanella sp.]